MPRSTWSCCVFAALLSLGIVGGLDGREVRAQSTEPVRSTEGETVPVLANRMNVEVPEKSSKILQFKAKVQRVDGFDPEIIAVTALSSNLIRVHALTQGITSLSVTDEAGQVSTVEIYVTGDARLLQAVLKRTFPETAVIVTKVGTESVLLRGWVTEPQQIQQIVDIARLYHANVLNQMKLGGPQEVQLRVKVMEVQRSKIRQFGLNFTIAGQNAGFASTPGEIGTLSALTVPFGGPVVPDLSGASYRNATLALGIAGANQTFQGLLDALRKEGLLKIQAETTLVTRSGEPARLINGGEFPIPVPQSLGTVTIQWKEFGVSLESLPVVVSPTRLKQTIVAQVSERDLSTAVALNGTTVPGLTKRTVETQAEMNFGETLVIGGLIYMRDTSETNKVPFLGELPLIGAAFRRVRSEQAETELLVMITPEYTSGMPTDMVNPNGPGMNTTTPTDRELFGQGLIEVPNYGEGPQYCPTPEMGGEMMPSPTPMPYASPDEVLPPPAPPAVLQEVPPTPQSPQLPPANVAPPEAMPPVEAEGPILPPTTSLSPRKKTSDWTAVSPQRATVAKQAAPLKPTTTAVAPQRVMSAAYVVDDDDRPSKAIQQTGATR